MTTYARRLGTFSAAMAVVGGIIGSGIFVGPAVVAQRLGTAGLTITAWVLGGVIALAGALCFAELGSRRPQAGGSYVYLRDAFGPLPAFLYGWMLLLAISTGATAAVAFTFARYFLPLVGLPLSAEMPVAVASIVVLSAVNFVGVKSASVTQNVFTVLKLAALAILIVVGLTSSLPNDLMGTSVVTTTPIANTFVALGAALVPVLFAYGGWQQTNFIAEEIVEPERRLPRALLIGTGLVVLVYVLANVTYLRALGVSGLAISSAPATQVMIRAIGIDGATIINAAIAISTFGFLNLVILVTPRVYQAMAADGLFFQSLAKLHPTHRTPAGAIVFQGVWATGLALTGTYASLLDWVVFADWIFFGLTAATLFVYRGLERRRGDASRTDVEENRTDSSGLFRTPGYPWVPAFFVLAAIYVVASSIGANLKNAAIGTGILILGVPVYHWWRTQRR